MSFSGDIWISRTTLCCLLHGAPALSVTAFKEQEDGPFAVIREFFEVNEGPMNIHS